MPVVGAIIISGIGLMFYFAFLADVDLEISTKKRIRLRQWASWFSCLLSKSRLEHL